EDISRLESENSILRGQLDQSARKIKDLEAQVDQLIVQQNEGLEKLADLQKQLRSSNPRRNGHKRQQSCDVCLIM
ncbi:unnamed protein product, partial [Heterosigma akashiwo]